MAKRYKVTKEQVEKIVEGFVMESAAPEAKKHVKVTAPDEKHGHSLKTSDGRTGRKQSAEAKKHMSGSNNSKQVEGRSNTPKVKEVKPGSKGTQAKEAKAHHKGELDENIFQKAGYALSGKYPNVEKLVSKLGDFKSKNPEGYSEVESTLNRYSNVKDQISLIKPSQSDKTFPFTEENFMALTGFHNFNVDVLKPIKLKDGSYVLPFKVKSGAGKLTGHSR
tara:strand:+ start:288 stop:950 length:663 start_codon:yes stop_codon:yes gene_type:complete